MPQMRTWNRAPQASRMLGPRVERNAPTASSTAGVNNTSPRPVRRRREAGLGPDPDVNRSRMTPRGVYPVKSSGERPA